MGRIIAPYPDTSGAVMDLIVQWFPEEFTPGPDEDFRVGRVFPPNVQRYDYFCRVKDIGGNDDRITDRPLIDVDILAKSFTEAQRLAFGIQARLLGAPWRIDRVVIDRATTAMRPHDVPWDDDATFRFYASYSVSVRRSILNTVPSLRGIGRVLLGTSPLGVG